MAIVDEFNIEVYLSEFYGVVICWAIHNSTLDMYAITMINLGLLFYSQCGWHEMTPGSHLYHLMYCKRMYIYFWHSSIVSFVLKSIFAKPNHQ